MKEEDIFSPFLFLEDSFSWSQLWTRTGCAEYRRRVGKKFLTRMANEDVDGDVVVHVIHRDLEQ